MATDEEKAAPVKSEEVDEARKLAEEWEAEYKEMQRQMSLLEEGTPFAKKNSTAGFEKPVLQRGLSTTSSDGAGEDGTGDKRTSQNFSEMEMIVRERFLLTERVDSLKDSIAVEYEARKKLK